MLSGSLNAVRKGGQLSARFSQEESSHRLSKETPEAPRAAWGTPVDAQWSRRAVLGELSELQVCVLNKCGSHNVLGWFVS